MLYKFVVVAIILMGLILVLGSASATMEIKGLLLVILGVLAKLDLRIDAVIKSIGGDIK